MIYFLKIIQTYTYMESTSKVCHQLLLLVNFTPHWLDGRACRFHLQGVTAVVNGW